MLQAEDRPGGVLVVRLYEAFGGQVNVTLCSSLQLRSVCRYCGFIQADRLADRHLDSQAGRVSDKQSL